MNIIKSITFSTVFAMSLMSVCCIDTDERSAAYHVTVVNNSDSLVRVISGYTPYEDLRAYDIERIRRDIVYRDYNRVKPHESYLEASLGKDPIKYKYLHIIIQSEEMFNLYSDKRDSEIAQNYYLYHESIPNHPDDTIRKITVVYNGEETL